MSIVIKYGDGNAELSNSKSGHVFYFYIPILQKCCPGLCPWHHLLFGPFPVFFLAACTAEKVDPDYEGYPTEVGKILVNRCAVSGCHNTASSAGAAGLDLSSWSSLFKGSNANSSVIPYRPDQSFLLFSVNHFSDLGPQLEPVMPLGQEQLSREQVELLRNWIGCGAPSDQGTVMWATPDTRSKIYVANQGCDMVTVFDADSRLVMRCIDVGNSGGTEAPHDMFVSPDGENLFVSFYASSLFQRYSTRTGLKTGEIDLGDMSWHSMCISGDSRYAITSHLEANGKVALIDLQTMSLVIKYQGSGLFDYSHGCALNYNGTLAYITCQQGNYIYRVDLTDPFSADIQPVRLDPAIAPAIPGVFKPYEVDFAPDYQSYYVTCQGTNELRVFNTANDSLINVIPTSGVPQLVTFSEQHPYAFVTCMEDSANAVTQSSVNVINTITHQLITTIYTGFQPRGMVVDDEHDLLWVANRNISGLGWAPHHTTACNGRNGYVTLIDIKSLSLVPDWKTEVTVDPYCVAIKHN